MDEKFGSVNNSQKAKSSLVFVLLNTVLMECKHAIPTHRLASDGYHTQ